MIPGKTYTPRDVLDAAWRRRWWIVAPFTVLATAALSIVTTLPRTYRSMATIQVVTDPVPDAYVRTAAQTRVADRLSSIGQATLTRTRLETIVKDLDLYPELRQSTVMEHVVERMRDQITFKATDRDLFVLGFAAQDPRVAHAVATRLTSLFLEENARDRGERAEANASFVDGQLAEVRKKLDDQDRQIEAYKARYAGQLPSQLSSNLQELNSAQLTLRSVLEAVSRDQSQRQSLHLDLASADAVVPSAGLIGPAPTGDTATAGQVPGEMNQLDAARATLAALELRLTPEHPDVQRMKRVISRLEQQETTDQAALTGGAAANRTLRRRDPNRAREIRAQIETLDRQIASNQDEARRLRARIDEYSRRVDAAPVREAELATLTRDYDDTKKLYSNLMARQQDASMTVNLESKAIGDRFRIIEPAQLPEQPIGQSRRASLLIGLLASLALSMGIGAMAEWRDSSLRSELDITVGLRLPVLATIPILNRTAPGRRR